MIGAERRGYRVVEASQQYGFSERQGWRLVATGEWPAIRVGRATIITASALEEWERRKRCETETAGGLGSYAAVSDGCGDVGTRG